MNNNKNVLLAIALAAAVLFVWQYFVATPAMKAEQARQAALTHQQKAKPAGAPSLPGIAAASSHMSREAALKAGGTRIVIDFPEILFRRFAILRPAQHGTNPTRVWIYAQGNRSPG